MAAAGSRLRYEGPTVAFWMHRAKNAGVPTCGSGILGSPEDRFREKGKIDEASMVGLAEQRKNQNRAWESRNAGVTRVLLRHAEEAS
jgi:hypothetical protein